jgi:hypothetical protein
MNLSKKRFAPDPFLRGCLLGPVIASILFVAGGPVRSQIPDSGGQALVPEKRTIIRRIAQHRVTMLGYQWKTRLEVRRDKKVILIRMEEIWFNEDGFFERRLLSEDPEKKEKKKEKKKDKADLVEEVIRLTRTYLLPSSLGLDETLGKAQASPGVGPNQGKTRIQIDSYNQAGDTVIYWLDDSNQRVTRLEVAARLKKDRVSVVADYQLLEGGASIAARTRVKVPGKKLEILHESFDFVRRDRDPS